MKPIVIIANTSWFVSNFFSSTIKVFKETYTNVVVIAPLDDYSSQFESLGCRFIDLSIDASGGNPLKEIQTLARIRALFRELDPLCVLSFTPKVNIYSAIASRSLNIPIVSTVSGLGSLFTEKTLTSWIGRQLLKVSRLSNHVVFQNEDDLDTYLKSRLVRIENTSRVKGIGLDTERFHPSLSAGINGNKTEFRFLMLSRLLVTKGTRIYVEAAKVARLKLKEQGIEAKFCLLGFVDEAHPQGIAKNEILSWHNNGDIDYLGESSAVENVIAAHDCVVLPSYYREGMPQCLMEAASMAKPVITTDHTGCRDTIDDGLTGFLIQKHSVSALTDAMVRMATLEPEQLSRMGRLAREKATKDFCYKKIARHYIDLVDQLN